MLSREDIDSYFRTRDWRFLKRGDNIWHTGFRAHIRNYQKGFEIFVHLASDWVYLQTPLLTVTGNRQQQHALFDFLLELNQRMFLAKFGLYQEKVLLLAELPRSCGVEEFNDALWSINEYAQRYFLEVSTINTDPEIALLWLNQARGQDGSIHDDMDEVPEIIFNS